MLYAIAITVKNGDFSDPIEYVQLDFGTSELLDNAAKFETREAAEIFKSEVSEYGKSAGWNVNYSIYDFEA